MEKSREGREEEEMMREINVATIKKGGRGMAIDKPRWKKVKNE